MIWLQFAICVLLILLAGSKAARYGDIIAEKTKLGRIWIGALLLAVVTSLPELVTSVSSVALILDPDLAVGTIIGTCIFNVMILVFLDIMYRPKPLLSAASNRHGQLIFVGIILAIILSAGLLLAKQLQPFHLGWVSIPSLLVVVFYLYSANRLAKGEKKRKHVEEATQYENVSLQKVLWKFVLVAMVIIGSGIWLSFIGEDIAVTTGWGSSFVGSVLLALTTSLPEITVAIAALRIGAVDLSIADILGANLLDLSYVFIIDIVYRRGPILSYLSQSHIVILALFVVMNLVVLSGLRFKAGKKFFRVASWYAPVLIGLYVAGTYLLFITQ